MQGKGNRSPSFGVRNVTETAHVFPAPAAGLHRAACPSCLAQSLGTNYEPKLSVE